MATLKLKNSFHNTTCNVIVTDEQASEHAAGVFDYVVWLDGRIYDHNDPSAKRQMRRIWNKLCGVKGCFCGITR